MLVPYILVVKRICCTIIQRTQKLEYNIYISNIVYKILREATAQAKAEPRLCLNSAQGLGFIFLKPKPLKAKPKLQYPGRA